MAAAQAMADPGPQGWPVPASDLGPAMACDERERASAKAGGPWSGRAEPRCPVRACRGPAAGGSARNRVYARRPRALPCRALPRQGTSEPPVAPAMPGAGSHTGFLSMAGCAARWRAVPLQAATTGAWADTATGNFLATGTSAIHASDPICSRRTLPPARPALLSSPPCHGLERCRSPARSSRAERRGITLRRTHTSFSLADHSTSPSTWRRDGLAPFSVATISSQSESLPEARRTNLPVAKPAGSGGGGGPFSRPALTWVGEFRHCGPIFL